jgi:carbonic anhydrase
MAQVSHVCQTTIVQRAWEQGQSLSVHGWVYGLRDGLVKDLNVSASGTEDVSKAYRINGQTPADILPKSASA